MSATNHQQSGPRRPGATRGGDAEPAATRAVTPTGTSGIAAEGGDDHYQPWLRNGDQPAGPVRPAPLPTRRVDGAAAVAPAAPVEDGRSARSLSADDLLARPLPAAAATPTGPGVVARVASALSAFADWTIRIGDAADIPARVVRLELGRRGRAVGALAGRSARGGADRVARATRDGAERVAHATQAGVAAAAPKLDVAGQATRAAISRGASGVRTGLEVGAARIGGAGRSIVDGAAARAKPASPVIESQLDRLLAEEAAPVAPTQPVAGLPLFAGTPPQAAAADQAMASPAAAASQPATPSGTGAWLRHPGTLALGAAALLGTGFAAGLYWTGPGVDRATTERVVHDYLLNNPEVLPQAMQRLQARSAAAAVDRLRARIETPFSGAWAGAPDGDVVLTVFTDYACTFCKASVPDIERLLREDAKLKVVFRELPILSPDSAPAARLALAAARRGRYMPMHRALFASGTPGTETRREAAIALDVANDAAATGDAAITREIEGNVALARELGFDGTPSWVVGDRLLTGAVGYDQLRSAIAAARAG